MKELLNLKNSIGKDSCDWEKELGMLFCGWEEAYLVDCDLIIILEKDNVKVKLFLMYDKLDDAIKAEDSICGTLVRAYYSIDESPYEDIITYDEDNLSGGIGDEIDFESLDQEQLDKGAKVEMEHTDDINLAREIAKDHLTEDKDYYKKLEVMETKASEKERCEHCGDEFDKEELVPLKFEPELKVCENCFETDMVENEED